MEPETLARDLAELKKVAHFARVQLVGGEPTLHHRIGEMLRVAYASGIAERVSVITNGRALRKMHDDFWRGLDVLQLSIYGNLPEGIEQFARDKCVEHGKIFEAREFGTFFKQFRETPGDGSNFAGCIWKNDCWTVHEGHFALCPQSLFFPKNFMGLPQFIDCLPLAEITPRIFSAFIDRKQPLNACRICMANELVRQPWREAKTREDWLGEKPL